MSIEAVYCDLKTRALVKVYAPAGTPENVHHMIYPRGRVYLVKAPQAQMSEGASTPQSDGYRRYVPGLYREEGL